MTVKPARVAIVGAGIDGLMLALALRRRGIAADLYEQAVELREIGAAVALSANGTREMERPAASTRSPPSPRSLPS
jgi:salicylate hydroxylase